jgi:hypothetical protein
LGSSSGVWFGGSTPIQIYVAQFGEEDQNLHFHLFPRTEALTRAYLQQFPERRALIHGPLLLDWTREQFLDDKMPEDTIRVLAGLRAHMGTSNRKIGSRATGTRFLRKARLSLKLASW